MAYANNVSVVGKAIKFTKEGYITIEVSSPKQEYIMDWELPELYPAVCNGQFHLQVQVKDSGCGVIPQKIPLLFAKFAKSRSASSQHNGVAGLGLVIYRRWFINFLFQKTTTLVCKSHGRDHIWNETEGLGKGGTVTFVVSLGSCNQPN